MSSPQAPNFDCFIRCDASQSIATGHVMRCLAIADQVSAVGGVATFVMADCPESLIAKIKTNKHQVVFLDKQIAPGTAGDAQALAKVARDYAAEHPTKNICLLLDGYHLLEDYRVALRQAAPYALAVIDDLHRCKSYSADLIINQNPGVHAKDYTGTDAQLLLGLGYAILREEFIRFKAAQAPKQIVGAATNIVVTMGGTDKDNATTLVLEALNKLFLESRPDAFFDTQGKTIEITAIVGGGNRHARELQSMCHDLSVLSLQKAKWTCAEAVKDMPATLHQADLLVSAGGTTIWEAAYLGVPTAALIIADNQKPGMRAFAATGAVNYLGLTEDNTAQSIAEKLLPLVTEKGATPRREMAAAAAVVDGHGAQRVVSAMAALKGNSKSNK